MLNFIKCRDCKFLFETQLIIQEKKYDDSDDDGGDFNVFSTGKADDNQPRAGGTPDFLDDKDGSKSNMNKDDLPDNSGQEKKRRRDGYTEGLNMYNDDEKDILEEIQAEEEKKLKK